MKRYCLIAALCLGALLQPASIHTRENHGEPEQSVIDSIVKTYAFHKYLEKGKNSSETS